MKSSPPNTHARGVQFRTVSAKLLDYIKEHGLKPGSRLPAERTFEQMWNISRPTINKAIACLAAQGYVQREGYRLTVSAPNSAPAQSPSIHVLCSQAEYQRATLVRHDLVESAYDVAARNNSTVIPLLARTREEQCDQLRTLLASEDCGGFVIWPLAQGEIRDILLQIREKGTPFVVCDLDMEDFDFVGIDNESGAAMAVNHLAELGHSELAYLTDSLSIPTLAQRRNGYQHACYANRLLPSIDRVIEVPGITPGTCYEALQQLRTGHPEVTAVFCSNDLLALNLIRIAGESGIQIPGQLSVVGFDDIDASALTTPALTTIAQDFHQQGIIATMLLFQRLLDRKRHQASAPCRLRLHPRFMHRMSTCRNTNKVF